MKEKYILLFPSESSNFNTAVIFDFKFSDLFY